ncbi:HpcH/HpaI aldolase/citrate lyase family protein [Burkholderia lata]|uniref:Citrate lyase subunit beta n=1 Tax=Burkholderia lata (strain ATCC 17760 / DSM 23089 / LMG 22485 / NCIMB 9086 / R18194 / 383) TaxID=482957 RepID=A0A6P2SR07_BURL3|nr:CoA ester lyase [Burkholderia lata]VWC51802.1 citrate lyase subunit beta [Burkholderia lata]
MKNLLCNAPSWRSLLYVPAHVPRFVDKAATCGADALLLDLEDSVPADRKALARDALATAVPHLKAAGGDVLVRVNGSLQWLVLDLRAAVAAGAGGVAIPKVLGASHLEAIDALLGELEDEHGVAHGATRVIAMVETPGAFETRARIARASPRIAALMLGGGDFALHCESDASADVLNVPKQLMVITARAAGVLPLGLAGTPDSLDDLDAFACMAQRSKAMGFAGATCIHPAQVSILNRAFAPADDEIRAAQTLIDAYEAARTDGLGALRVDGKMIDAPVVERARRVLARHQALLGRAQAASR